MNIRSATNAEARAAIMGAVSLEVLCSLLRDGMERRRGLTGVISDEEIAGYRLPNWGPKPEDLPLEAFSWNATHLLMWDEDPGIGWYIEPRLDLEEDGND